MTKRTTFLTRFLAMALALVLCASNVMPGLALNASAATDASVQLGELMAKTYEMSEAEAALLKSGYLYGDMTIAYKIPDSSDELVTVDTASKTISAKSFNQSWAPYAARVEAENTEDVALAYNAEKGVFEGNYEYVGNTFSVEVDYQLPLGLSPQMNTMMTASKNLVAGLDKMAAAYNGTKANLGTISAAMDVLVQLADGRVAEEMGGFVFKMDEAGANAVYALKAEIDANGGMMNLEVKNDAYVNAAYKTEYLVNSGADYCKTVASAYANLKAIAEDGKLNHDTLDFYLENYDEASFVKWSAMKKILNDTVAALAPVAGGDWATTNLVSDVVDYEKLEGMLVAVDVAVSDPIIVDKATIQANLNMANVGVNVSLKIVDIESVDSEELVQVNAVSDKLTKSIGASMTDIEAEVRALAETLVADWDAIKHSGEHFEIIEFVAPEGDELTEDVEYTIVYGPKNYTVSTNFAGDKVVPYGYNMTLPTHSDVTKSYDYVVSGNAFPEGKVAQGTVINIFGDATVEQSSGKAYAGTSLYKVVADNYGNESTKAILNSGALKGDETISYRKPDPTDAEALLKLVDNVLTAEATYAADYKDQVWVPYTYGVEGTENKFSGSTADWTKNEAKVKYILNLTNFSAERVAGLLSTVESLKTEAEGHTSVLNSLANNYETMGKLDIVKLGGLNGVIGVTDFTPGDGDRNDAKTQDLRAYFSEVVGKMIDNNVDTNDYLYIYNYMTSYMDETSGGLKYFYKGDNAATIIAEVEELANYLDKMVGEPEALKILCVAADFPEVAEQITDLQGSLNYIRENLTAPSSIINTNSEFVGKFVDALATEDTVENAPAGVPYLVSETLTATDPTQVLVQVKVDVAGKSETFTTPAQDKGVLSTAAVKELQDKIDAYVDGLLGANKKYYELTVDGADLSELAGEELLVKTYIDYNYTVRNYTVKIAGEADQKVTFEDLEIDLPAHPNAGFRYEYTVDGKVLGKTADSYTFTLEQLDSLFKNGVYTIARKEIDEASEKLEDAFGGSTTPTEPADPDAPVDPDTPVTPSEPQKVITLVKDENGKIVGQKAVMSGDKGGLTQFVTELVNNGNFSYVGFDGEPFMYMNEENILEISLQSLINAIAKDETFTSQTLVNLGNNGKGILVNTTVDYGTMNKDQKSRAAASYTVETTQPMTIELSSVPAQMAKIAKGLTAVKDYMTFYSNGEEIEVKLNLPEAVYEAYLTAMIGTKNLEKLDVNAMSNLVAYNFFNDYLQLIVNDYDDAVSAKTYENTLNMLIKEANDLTDKGLGYVDLEGYQGYYEIVADLLKGGDEKLVITPNEADLTVKVTARDNHITKLTNILGIDLSGMKVAGELTADKVIKEFKNGGSVTTTVRATVVDANEDYEAVVVNVAKTNSKKAFLNNIYDFTSDLSASVADMSGAAFIMLLDDVADTINLGCKTAIIDLNGKTVGGINYTGSKLVVMDSSRETVSGAGVTGTVSGNVTILAGNYPNQNVSSMLPDGYYQSNGNVLNALYTVENGAEYTIDTDKLFDENYVEGYLPAVHYLAAEIALDMMLNHYSSAALSVATEGENYDIFAVSFDDLVGMVGSESNKDKIANLVNDVLGMYRFENIGEEGKGGIDGFISKVVMQLTDFDAVRDAVKNGTVLAKYDFTTQPWLLNIKHVADGDYLTAGIVSNAEKAETISLSLKFAGKNKDKTLRVLGELAETVFVNDFMIDLHQPKVKDDLLNVGGSAVTDITLDFSRNCDFNRMLAAIVAFAHEDLTKDFVKNGCIMDLNDILAEITVGDFFEAIKKAVEAKEWDFAALAKKADVELSAAQVEKLNEYYDKFQRGAGKVLAKLELKTDRFVPMSELLNPHGEIGAATFTVDADIKSHDAAADYRGYGVKVTLDGIDVKLTVKLAPKCNGLWGDVNWDGKVNTKDATKVLRYSAKIIEADELHRCVADVNGDGKINTKDATQILRKAARIIDKFPVEE